MLRRSFNLGATQQQGALVGEELSRIDTTFRRRMRLWLGVLATVWVVSLLAVLVALSARPAYADDLGGASAPAVIIINNNPPPAPAPAQQEERDQSPPSSWRWKRELLRASYSGWGLDAPVALFAAQIEQESAWRPSAISHVGASGLGQFMPATASWWCRINKIPSGDCRPRNPTWALRALVGYDRWLWDQLGRHPGVSELSEFDRAWAMLRSYNGGMGHWQAESRIARSAERQAVDAACGRARRQRSHCRENLGYPQRILSQLQPRYASWGPAVELAASGGER